MEDYEFYSVDNGEYYIKEDTLLKNMHAEEDLANFFRPARTIHGMAIKFFGDAVLVKCETIADAEATLLGGIQNIIV